MAHELASSLRRARSEPTAFRDVYEAMAARLLAYFARRTFDVEAAADLTAETMARAFQHRRRFRGSTDAEAEAWVQGIARHQLSHYVRKGIVERRALERLGIDVPALDDDDHARIVELAGLAEMRGRVAAAFGELSPEQHDVLRLRIIDERSYSDTAAALGVSEQTARARVSRALRRLADAMELAATQEVTP